MEKLTLLLSVNDALLKKGIITKSMHEYAVKELTNGQI